MLCYVQAALADRDPGGRAGSPLHGGRRLGRPAPVPDLEPGCHEFRQHPPGDPGLAGRHARGIVEGLGTGIPASVRFQLELWQYNSWWVDRRVVAKLVERQVVYDVLTKEFRVAALQGEEREPYVTRDVWEAERVLSELRVLQADADEPSEPGRALLRAGSSRGAVRRAGLLRLAHLAVRLLARGDALGADAPPHPPAGAMSATTPGPSAGPAVGALPPPVVRPPDDREKRKRNLFIIVGVLVVLVVATAVEVGVRLPDIPVASNVVVIALFNLNLIVFLLLLILLFRNLAKLWLERRHKVLGSRFKTKLVAAFLSLALAPAILIFLIASNLINTSIEGWFKIQVERPLDESMRVAQTFYERVQDEAVRHGQYIARTLARDGLLPDDRREDLIEFLQEQDRAYGHGGIALYGAGGHEIVHVNDPVLVPCSRRWSELESRSAMALAGRELSTRRESRRGDLIQGDGAGAGSAGRPPRVVGAAVVAIHLPQRLEAQVRGIAQAFQEYKQLKLLRQPDQGYLHPAVPPDDPGHRVLRHLVRPVSRPGHHGADPAARPGDPRGRGRQPRLPGLGPGGRRGRHPGGVLQPDDPGPQVLEGPARAGLRGPPVQARRARRAAAVHRDRAGGRGDGRGLGGRGGIVTTVNRAASRMLGIAPSAAVGRHYAVAFGAPAYLDLVTLMQRMERIRAGTVERELKLPLDGKSLTLLTSLTAPV